MNARRLGEQLALLRRRHDISQVDVCRAMGWAHASSLSRIESGQTQVEREAVEQLADFMVLAPDERTILLSAGHFVPTEEDVAAARAIAVPILASLPYAATLIDFRWVIQAANPVIYGMVADVDALIDRYIGSNQLDLILDPQASDPDRFADPPFLDWMKDVVGQFRAQHRDNVGEDWYREIVRRLLRDPIIRAIWEQTSSIPRPLINVGFMRYTNGARYVLVSSPLAADQRFQIVQYIPTNPRAHREAEEGMQQGLQALQRHPDTTAAKLLALDDNCSRSPAASAESASLN